MLVRMPVDNARAEGYRAAEGVMPRLYAEQISDALIGLNCTLGFMFMRILFTCFLPQ